MDKLRGRGTDREVKTDRGMEGNKYRDDNTKYICVLVAQPCPTLCDPMGCSPPGSSVHGIPQATLLQGVAICYSKAATYDE